ncbi:hypothetical protein CK203_084964 [Vitis vinifera]|uniref:Retrovirus-related Pol polyprotein from transposon RE2 n=1 Tax=Vitis vinifera TaxID=29760 RepID=A0A438CXD7_VITVI|nr:hypothetical protein CK203_084964 [Vitis vinifera]
MTTKNQIFTSVLSGSPLITSEKLVAGENYLSWSASVELWFMGQGYEDHLVTQEADIPEVDRVQWRKIDAQPKDYTRMISSVFISGFCYCPSQPTGLDLSTYIGQIASLKEQFLTVMPLTPDVGAQQTQLDKFFMVLTLIGLRPDLEPIRDQILGSSSVPSLDDVFARLLRISSTQTVPSDSASDSSVLVSQTTSRGGRSVPEPPSSSASQTSQASIASVAQPGNASACLTHTSSLGPWILDSGASDHLSGNKDLFSSITTTSDLPTVTLANGSQTVAKGIGLALPLPSLPLTSVLYTPECPFNLISISKITRTLNCSITFSDKFVTLQDRSTGKTIGIGRELKASITSPQIHLLQFAFPLMLLSSFTIVWATLVSPSSRRWFLVFPLVVASVDNAREYFSAQFTSFMSHHGILHQSSLLILLNQNGGQAFRPNHEVPLLGYSRLEKGYRCYSLETHRYFISVDVTFFEDSPFFSTTSESLPVSEVLPIPIVSPPDAMPLRPLQVYHRRPRVVAPLPFPEAPADSLPIPSASPASALPSPNDLPMLFRKVLALLAMVDEMTALHSNARGILLFYPLLLKAILKFMVSDYGDTFSPVAKMLLSACFSPWPAMCSWPLYQWILKMSSFMYLAEEVYMEQPPGFVAPGGVCTADHSVFYHHNSLGQCIYLVVYVDDIVITAVIRMIAQSSSGVVLSQRKYALDILEETGMLDCKPVDTPMIRMSNLYQDRGAFRRPREISTARSHWDAVIRILRYIKSTSGQGVLYENRCHTQVVVTQMQIGLAHPQIDVPLQGVEIWKG